MAETADVAPAKHSGPAAALSAAGRPYPDIPALPACATGQRLDARDLRLGAQQRLQPGRQSAGQPRSSGHDLPVDTVAVPPALACDTRSTARAWIVKRSLNGRASIRAQGPSLR